MTGMKERVDSEAKFKIKDKREKCLELSQTDTFSDPQTVKNRPANMGLIPGLERSPGEGNGYPLKYSCLERSRDRET